MRYKYESVHDDGFIKFRLSLPAYKDAVPRWTCQYIFTEAEWAITPLAVKHSIFRRMKQDIREMYENSNNNK